MISLKLTISSLQDVQTDYPLSQIGPYEWQKGDRIRGITKAGATGAYGDLVDTQTDLEIQSFDPDTSIIVVQSQKQAGAANLWGGLQDIAGAGMSYFGGKAQMDAMGSMISVLPM